MDQVTLSCATESGQHPRYQSDKVFCDVRAESSAPHTSVPKFTGSEPDHWTGKPLVLYGKNSTEALPITATYLGLTSRAETLKLLCILLVAGTDGNPHTQAGMRIQIWE